MTNIAVILVVLIGAIATSRDLFKRLEPAERKNLLAATAGTMIVIIGGILAAFVVAVYLYDGHTNDNLMLVAVIGIIVLSILLSIYTHNRIASAKLKQALRR